MIHIALHFIVPAAVAWIFFKNQFRHSWLVMCGTMIVDLDHLIADPVYDPNRCSIGFHPLHSAIAISIYVLMLAFPRFRLVFVGLLLHMALDLGDCLMMHSRSFD